MYISILIVVTLIYFNNYFCNLTLLECYQSINGFSTYHYFSILIKVIIIIIIIYITHTRIRYNMYILNVLWAIINAL